jgi:hypothetical protein
MKTHPIMKRALFALPMILAAALCRGQDRPSSTAAQNGEVIFAIGKEDKTDAEFRSWGWNGKEEYECDAAACTDDAFPAELHIRGAYDSYGVVRLRIVFQLDRSYDRIVLRLVRGGDETTVVKVDDKATYQVTNTMLGSAEGFQVGSYELSLGALAKGKHSLEFTVAEDGKGNGAYQWDALKLFGM